jgi:DNA-binding protein WhiA
LDFDSSPEVYLKQFQSIDAIAGYLSGLFLASGSVNHPSSSHYHLELSSDDEDFLTEIQRLLKQVKSLRFSFKLLPRKGKYILYLKKSDQIADFLIFMGATESTLEYENIRVARDFTNSENRLQICENANMAKTIAAAKKQKEAIQLIDQIVGIEKLNHPRLEKLSRLRMKYDSSSLEELSMMMSDHFQKPISKSQLNHHFRAILALAQKLKGTP